MLWKQITDLPAGGLFLHRNRKSCYVAHSTDILTRREFTVTPSAKAHSHKEYKNCHYKFLNFKFTFVYLYIYIYIYIDTHIQIFPCACEILQTLKIQFNNNNKSMEKSSTVFMVKGVFFSGFRKVHCSLTLNCGIKDKGIFIY